MQRRRMHTGFINKIIYEETFKCWNASHFALREDNVDLGGWRENSGGGKNYSDFRSSKREVISDYAQLFYFIYYHSN